MARIFSLTPMLRPGIKLMSAELHLFEGPRFRTLYRLSYLCKVTTLDFLNESASGLWRKFSTYTKSYFAGEQNPLSQKIGWNHSHRLFNWSTVMLIDCLPYSWWLNLRTGGPVACLHSHSRPVRCSKPNKLTDTCNKMYLLKPNLTSSSAAFLGPNCGQSFQWQVWSFKYCRRTSVEEFLDLSTSFRVDNFTLDQESSIPQAAAYFHWEVATGKSNECNKKLD